MIMRTVPSTLTRAGVCMLAALFITTSVAPVSALAQATTTTAASSAPITSLLKVGSTGAQVTKLQQVLVAEGYLKAAPTGYFGPLTRAAVIAFQKAKGIDQVGYTGPATRAALNKAAGSASAGTSANAPVTSASTTPVVSNPLPNVGFEIAGWLPYWREAQGAEDVKRNLSKLTEINPFGYTVRSDGTLYDAMGVNSEPWTSLFSAARAQNVRVVPTVMWSDTASIHTTLSDPQKRAAHIANIVSTVTQNRFDGIDIDYEGKRYETGVHFSSFLTELRAALKAADPDAVLDCTIEARTPPDSLSTRPDDVRYGNDFKVFNEQCDRVRLMTYDQQRADIKLNASHEDKVYAPVADPAWIRKVIEITTKEISKDKLMLGIATYGYDWQVMPNSDGSGYSYTIIEAFNPKYAVDTAAQLGITPTRNAAGELSFTYVPANTPAVLPSHSQVSSYAPRGTASALMAALGALNLVRQEGRQAPFHVLWWSDAKAIEDKVNLAKEYGLKGVAVFKFDGGSDPEMWSVLKK